MSLKQSLLEMDRALGKEVKMGDFLPKEDIYKMLDTQLTEILGKASPKDRYEITEELAKMMVKYNSNLILDKKEENNG